MTPDSEAPPAACWGPCPYWCSPEPRLWWDRPRVVSVRARLLVPALIIAAVGIVLRSLPGTVSLFAGTAVLAAGIAFCNVLLPAVIKATARGADIGRLTALYVTVMGSVAAISSGVAVPLADALPGGWRASLGIWAVLAVIAVLYCVLPPVRRGGGPRAAEPAADRAQVWTSGLAWTVSLFMGLQSVTFYAMVSWLPSIVVDRGQSDAAGGWQLTVFQAAGLVSSTLLVRLLRHRRDQRTVTVAATLVCGGGLALLLVAPPLAWVASVLIGLGGGACIVLALSFQSLRASDPSTAAGLAGMAQTVGYSVAAAAPIALGILHDATRSWTWPVLLLVALSVLQAVVGLRAGADREITVRTVQTPRGPSS